MMSRVYPSRLCGYRVALIRPTTTLCDVDQRTGLPVVGMVGAGQLARMTHQAAIALGQSLRILAASPDDGAALVAADVVVGDYRSLADLRAFAAGCDVVTFDHEHVPTELLEKLGRNSRKAYEKYFTLDRFGADFLKLVEEAISSSGQLQPQTAVTSMRASEAIGSSR